MCTYVLFNSFKTSEHTNSKPGMIYLDKDEGRKKIGDVTIEDNILKLGFFDIEKPFGAQI